VCRGFVHGRGMDPATVMAGIHAKSRDNARTPMQWDDSPNAGFTSGTPWIGVNPNYPEINVGAALADPGSVFHYYRKLIRLRKENPVIVHGRYDLLLESHGEIYAFTRTHGDHRLLVILNFTANRPVFALPAGIAYSGKDLVISNYEVEPAEDIALLTLRPYEALVYRLT
jgi:oligo-1,6-glucosidase